ncbi:uncharacterized protein LOC115447026 [Manduca sexta]|uniref:uncharacterized protein LOC115447026 n=1 Tax=Manduca sexta TaxID=7130 RepID=UPI00188E4F9F|nr:uncharacterized protein LOC115447026 [Manduca sexta]XP_037300238.1 uncharacterized protein LOC115447026 [Manduca sexta]XP_037300239.1 uncharacterized protein LOC115447026 [Manduca sexta]
MVKKLEWTLECENGDWKRYKIAEVTAWMHGTWSCNISADRTLCDLDVKIIANDSWSIKVNGRVIGPIQYNENDNVSVAEHEFCENERALVDCGKLKPANITFKVQDEPSIKYIRNNTVQAEMFMKMKSEHNGKYIECHHNYSGVESVVRIKLKLKTHIYDSMSQYDDHNTMCSTDSYATVDFKTSLDICNFDMDKSIYGPPGPTFPHELKGLQPSNVAFLFKNLTDDKEVHYEYSDKEMLNISWNINLVPNIFNEYTMYWKDTLLSSLPIMTTQASNNLMQVYDPITLGPADDGTVIRFVVTIGERTVDKYRIILRRLAPDTAKDDFWFYVITGVLGCIIIILIVNIIWILKKIKRRKSEPVIRRNVETCSNVYEEIAPFPPQWDKQSWRETINSVYEGAEAHYSEIKATAEQRYAK